MVDNIFLNVWTKSKALEKSPKYNKQGGWNKRGGGGHSHKFNRLFLILSKIFLIFICKKRVCILKDGVGWNFSLKPLPASFMSKVYHASGNHLRKKSNIY